MRSFYKFLIVIVILAVGLGITAALVKTKPQVERRPVSISPPLVEFVEVESGPQQVSIEAAGTPVPAKQISLQAQVPGVVVWMNPELEAGHLVQEGEELLRIDPRDYELALEQQRVNLTKARLDLETEQGKAEVARREWEILKEEIAHSEAGRELALRGPQLENARAALEAAESAVKQAELNLERTVVRAPFNAVVLSEQVDRGQLIAKGAPIAELAGSDAFRIESLVPADQLSWFDIPGVQGNRGSPVTVIQKTGSRVQEFSGEVERLLPGVDPNGLMARVMIRVPDPYGRQGSLPLLLGSYARVEITGRVLEDVVAIPGESLRQGDRIWLIGSGDTLEAREVRAVWRRTGEVIVQGLATGERVITSRISSPVEGMLLRPVADGNQVCGTSGVDGEKPQKKISTDRDRPQKTSGADKKRAQSGQG